MRYIAIILLLFAGGMRAQSQIEPSWHWPLDYTGIDSTLSGDDVVLNGDATYDESIVNVGSHSVSLQGSKDYIKTPTIDLGNNFIVSLWIRSNSDIADYRFVMTAADSVTPTIDNFYLRGIATNQLKYYVGTSSATVTYTWTSATWHNIIFHVNDNGTNAIIRTWIDRNRMTMPDSTLDAGWTKNTRWNFGVDCYLNGEWIGNIDEIVILKNVVPTSTVINELYTGSWKNTGSQTISYRNRIIWFNKGNFEQVDEVDPEPAQNDSIVFLFAENFETFPITSALSYDTVINHFQVWKNNFYTPYQSIVDLNDGDHEKVWHSKILENEWGASKGFEIFIPVDTLYNELWVDLDMRAMPGFNGDETPGYHSGKLPMGGAYGGLNYSYYGDSTRISSEEWGAWWAHTVWGSNESMHNYAYTLSGAKDADGYIGQIPTSWKHYSTKIKVSDPGSLNGTKEVFIDGDYSSHLVGLKMRSIAQGKDYGLIEGVKLSFFFGGSDYRYASQQDQWIEFDNIVVSYANSGTRKNTDLYTTGNKIWYPNSTLNNVQPDSILFCEDFTANSGTIQSHYTINRPPDSKRTYRKTITVTEGSHINIDFDYYRYDYDYGNNSWMKIYTGVGGSKSATPLYTFNRSNLASTYSTYHISDNEVTIEYYMGTNNGPSKGWKLTYEEVLP